jgi:Glycosyl transferase family 2
MQISVIIPTRERVETLRHSIETCVNQNYIDLDIVVCDNASSDNTAEVVSSFADKRIRYVRSSRRLSMTGNFEFSLDQVSTGFVTQIGDDDGLVPDAVDYVAWIIRNTGAKAVTSSHAVYHWPNSPLKDYRNKLIFSTNKGYEWRNSLEVAKKVVNWTERYPSLPSTYSGFIDRSVIDAASHSGLYFNSVTPDSYSGFINAGVIDQYIYSRRPFMVSGISGKSNGASHSKGGNSEGVSIYEAENDTEHHPKICYNPFSLPLIVAEAFLQAQERSSKLQSIKLDIAGLCRQSLLEADGYHYDAIYKAVCDTALRHSPGQQRLPLPDSWDLLMYRCANLKRKVAMAMSGYRKFQGDKRGIETIADACDFIGSRVG